MLANFSLPVFFILLGAISIISQTVLLREITTLFYGNEIFYGLGLGIWLFFTGFGSLLAGQISALKRWSKLPWLILAGLSFLLPFPLIGLRLTAAKIIPLGELPSPWFAFLIPGGSLSFFCFLLGAVFPLAAKKTVNRAYLWETLGFAFGGLIFSFILATTSFPLPAELNRLTASWRYPNLSKVVNSKYNQIVVSTDNGQRNFFIGGQFAFNTQEDFENQKLLALIKPFVSNYDQVLVLTNPTLAETIKKEFVPNRIDFLEIDKRLLEEEKEILKKEINPIVTDPRKYLNQTKQKWNLIIYAPVNPQTLLSNRYFTKESFEQIQNRLEKEGVFVLLFYLPTDYQSREAVNFGGSIYHTFKSVFPETELLIQEDQIILLGGIEEIRLEENRIEKPRGEYFWHQYQSLKRKEILNKLTGATVKINTDFEPAAFFYQQLFWQTIFSFQTPKVIEKVSGIAPLVLLLLLTTALWRSRQNLTLGLLIGSLSFVLISLETLIIFIFQTKIGYLYSQISLIFASFLSGMALGVWLTKRVRDHSKTLKQVLIALLISLFTLGFVLDKPAPQWPILWFGLSAVLGIFGGAVFALTNNLYFKKGAHPGFIYAFDLFGSSLGALLTSSFLLPVLGTQGLLLNLSGIVAICLFASIAKLRK